MLVHSMGYFTVLYCIPSDFVTHRSNDSVTLGNPLERRNVSAFECCLGDGRFGALSVTPQKLERFDQEGVVHLTVVSTPTANPSNSLQGWRRVKQIVSWLTPITEF
jgi:hypothetical protein